ncbi:MAG: MdtA/MuxA family multidrug efflux RND transporter periplasmic adaptor subunit [Betaproteobacteria bacterium]|nr:MdtA/MuxA family multidrug efflux RND transporter periplasmic adaptor subunit [Betaproteobacteria bacterium]
MSTSSNAFVRFWQGLPGWGKIVLPLLILALIGGGAWYVFKTGGDAGTGNGKDTAKAGPPGKGGRFGNDPNRQQPVAAAAARTADINVVQTALGTVAALKIATVKARVDGLLQDVSFREGQIVQAGDVLAEIDAQPFKVALSQVEGQLARDQAQLANARLDLERYRTLLEQDSVSKQQLDSQDALVRQFEGTVKIDQAQVDNAKLNLGYTKVTAPISGRLGLRVVDPGNIVHSSDAAGLVVITQVDPITVIFPIPQDNLQRVLKQLKAGERLAVDAWDREQKNRLASGFLLSVDNQIDTTTGTVKLKAQFPNPDGLLFPNQFVNVKMVVDVKRDATVIPLAAIQRGAAGTIVYVIKDDKTTTTRPVVMGPSENDNVAIESGLAVGEMVVTDGVDRLREGAKVEVTATFVPKVRAPGEGKRGQWGGKGGPNGPPAAPAAGGKPGEAAVVAPAPANAATAPAAPEGGRQGGWGGMTDEQKAVIRKKMEGMSDEQKAEFRKKMQERRQQQGQ